MNLLKEIRPEVDLAIESPGVDLLAPLWNPDGGQAFGWQEDARWVEFAEWLAANGMLSNADDASDAFDNSNWQLAVRPPPPLPRRRSSPLPRRWNCGRYR